MNLQYMMGILMANTGWTDIAGNGGAFKTRRAERSGGKFLSIQQ